MSTILTALVRAPALKAFTNSLVSRHGVLKVCFVKCRDGLFQTESRNVQTTGAKLRFNLDFDLSKEVLKDLKIYEYYRPYYFMMVQGLSLVGFIVFVYLAQFAFKYIKSPTPQDEMKKVLELNPSAEQSKGYYVFEKIARFSGQYKYILTGICIFIGYGSLVASTLYTTRSVHGLILKRGGNDVTILTSPFIPTPAKFRRVNVPLKDISCRQSRDESTDYISMKVKGHRFYYLIDKKGIFFSPDLFDRSVGMSRRLGK